MSDGAMVANVDITRFCRAIVLVTNRAVVRDLEVSAPPNFMSLRRASFWTCPKKQTDTMSLSFLGRLGWGGWGGIDGRRKMKIERLIEVIVRVIAQRPQIVRKEEGSKKTVSKNVFNSKTCSLRFAVSSEFPRIFNSVLTLYFSACL